MTPGGEKHFLNLITLFELFLRDKHTIFAEKIKSRAPTLNFVENTLAYTLQTFMDATEMYVRS